MSISKSDSYAAAGVDVTAGYESVNRIKPLVESTNIPGVIGGLGGFGGLFAPDLIRYEGARYGFRHRWCGHQAENRIFDGQA